MCSDKMFSSNLSFLCEVFLVFKYFLIPIIYNSNNLLPDGDDDIRTVLVSQFGCLYSEISHDILISCSQLISAFSQDQYYCSLLQSFSQDQYCCSLLQSFLICR